MKPLTKQRQPNISVGHGSSSPTLKLSLPFPEGNSLHVIGVMFPIAVRQAHEHSPNNWPSLPPDVTSGRKSTDVIFYDPLSSQGSGNPNKRFDLQATSEVFRSSKTRNGLKRGKEVTRTQALEAVARDLAMLAVQKRR